MIEFQLKTECHTAITLYGCSIIRQSLGHDRKLYEDGIFTNSLILHLPSTVRSYLLHPFAQYAAAN